MSGLDHAPDLPPMSKAFARLPRLTRFAALAALAAFAAVAPTACVVEHDAPPPTEIEFGEVTNLGEHCGGPLSSWTVSCRETADTGTAGCEQPVLFTNLTGGAVYTFDVAGHSGDRACWQGTCTVQAVAGATVHADCASQITHLCGF